MILTFLSDVPFDGRPSMTPHRFGSDYELRGRLGKGGFGVVYHVKNRTDDGEYAVKRILLPRKSVLARLLHTHCYYAVYPSCHTLPA